MKVDDPIAESFDLVPIDNENNESEVIEYDEIIENSSKTQKDLDYIRKNLKDTITKGQKALDDFIEIANQGQSAREFEVVATLMKTVADNSKLLMEYNKQKTEILKNENPGKEQGPSTINNNLIMTTEALGRMLKKLDDGE